MKYFTKKLWAAWNLIKNLLSHADTGKQGVLSYFFPVRPYSVNLTGRIKNFSLPKSKPLVPLFEAVVNSLHAIEDRKKIDTSFKSGKITVDIVRSKQETFNGVASPNVEGFVITDNGIGFTNQNLDSFLESDSTYKSHIGGKGIGRFSWLKAFQSVEISSVFRDGNRLLERNFTFVAKNNTIDDTVTSVEKRKGTGTKIVLNTYLSEYGGSVPKDLDKLASEVMYHCLAYLINAVCPKIILRDGTDTREINKMFREEIITDDNVVKFCIGGGKDEFSLLHVKVKDSTFEGNKLYLCADSRLVLEKDLEAYIVDLDSQIVKNQGFWYIGVLTGQYLNDHVDMNRLSFSIPEHGTGLRGVVSQDEILHEASSHVERYLHEYLVTVAKEKHDRIEKYVTTNSPQYRHLLMYMPEQIKQIKHNVSNDKLDDELHHIKRDFEKISKKETHDLLKSLKESNMTSEEYEQNFEKHIRKISDANKSVLADYVTRRKVIIDLLENGLLLQSNAKYNKESYLHNLIYPMRKTSDDTDYESHNLWLLDERLSYCYYIASDIAFHNDPQQSRPDVLVLDSPVAVGYSEDKDRTLDSIFIFELKRPMRNDYTEGDNPVSQLMGYVTKVRGGEVKDKHGRPIRVNSSTKYYLYAVCDIDSKLRTILTVRGFTATPDSSEYYWYNPAYNAYVSVLSYDKILQDAKKRNRIFFEKLGIG